MFRLTPKIRAAPRASRRKSTTWMSLAEESLGARPLIHAFHTQAHETERFAQRALLWQRKPRPMLMEFLESPTLSHVIFAQKNHHLSVGNAMRIAIYIGSALIHMHRKEYLHLDVKASNIIIFRSRPVLIDVGTARKISAGKPAGIIGTDTNMSPEQCLREKLSPASDVFVLGVLLFRMLSGEFPFLQKRSSKHFAQVSQRPLALRTVRPSVPRGLEKLIYACLARDALQRPTLEKLLSQLHCFITSGAAMWPEQITQRRNAQRKLRSS